MTLSVNTFHDLVFRDVSFAFSCPRKSRAKRGETRAQRGVSTKRSNGIKKACSSSVYLPFVFFIFSYQNSNGLWIFWRGYLPILENIWMYVSLRAAPSQSLVPLFMISPFTPPPENSSCYPSLLCPGSTTLGTADFGRFCWVFFSKFQ